VKEAEQSKDLIVLSLLVPEVVLHARGSPGVAGQAAGGEDSLESGTS